MVLLVFVFLASSRGLVAAFQTHADTRKNRLSFAPSHALRADRISEDDSFRRQLSSVGDRDFTKLLDWASSRGVVIPDGVSISCDVSEGCGVLLTKTANEGTVILSVPWSLVLSSSDLPKSIEATMDDVCSILESAGVSQYIAEFRLMIRLLIEKQKRTSSAWHPWIESLPSSFTTGLYLDDVEKSQLSPYVLALVEFQEVQFDAFRNSASVVADSFSLLSPIFEGGRGDELVKWAFSVVFTRSWRSQSGDEATIVPVGDMFNHREVADVEVAETPASDCISFVLKNDVKAQSEIHLCYGPHSPANFIAVFGFVDESMMTVPSHIEIPNADNNVKLVRLGCTERKNMVYRRDGAISDAVWDCILFASLASRHEEQEEFYEAVVDRDDAKKTAIHSKYALEVSLSLLSHVEQVLDKYPDPGTSIVDLSAVDLLSHKMLPMVLQYNESMRGAYQKVRDRLKEKVENERRKRMKILSS